jgi:hypothetical protein
MPSTSWFVFDAGEQRRFARHTYLYKYNRTGSLSDGRWLKSEKVACRTHVWVAYRIWFLGRHGFYPPLENWSKFTRPPEGCGPSKNGAGLFFELACLQFRARHDLPLKRASWAHGSNAHDAVAPRRWRALAILSLAGDRRSWTCPVEREDGATLRGWLMTFVALSVASRPKGRDARPHSVHRDDGACHLHLRERLRQHAAEQVVAAWQAYG